MSIEKVRELGTALRERIGRVMRPGARFLLITENEGREVSRKVEVKA